MKRIMLPRYVFGKDDELTDQQIADIDDSYNMQYIRAIENADSVGWNPVTKRWTPPTSAAFDKNALGMGLDKRYGLVADFLSKKGRTANPYLTEAEERMLRAKMYKEKQALVNRTLKNKKVSTNKKDSAILMGMAWQGDPMGKINTPGSVTRTAIQPLIDSGKPIGQAAFDAYYGYPDNAKRYADRVKRHNAFFGIIPAKTTKK